jgi:hypothetical protein
MDEKRKQFLEKKCEQILEIYNKATKTGDIDTADKEIEQMEAETPEEDLTDDEVEYMEKYLKEKYMEKYLKEKGMDLNDCQDDD